MCFVSIVEYICRDQYVVWHAGSSSTYTKNIKNLLQLAWISVVECMTLYRYRQLLDIVYTHSMLCWGHVYIENVHVVLLNGIPVKLEKYEFWLFFCRILVLHHYSRLYVVSLQLGLLRPALRHWMWKIWASEWLRTDDRNLMQTTLLL